MTGKFSRRQPRSNLLMMMMLLLLLLLWWWWWLQPLLVLRRWLWNITVIWGVTPCSLSSG